MSLLCLGLSHQSAPIELRERVAVSAAQLGEAARTLKARGAVDEAVVVSTCNRTELYLVGEASRLFAAGSDFLRLRAGLSASADLPLFAHLDQAAANHLCRVAGGLESMVLGETEILGQTKQAYQQAHVAGATGGQLNRLFQHAFRIAKKIRSETAIQRGATSVAAVAVELAERIFGDLGDCRTMVLGAGDTSRQMAKALASRGVPSLIVSNRNRDRAVELAAEIGATALPFEGWKEELRRCDILLAATGAPHALIHKADLAPVVARRTRPLFAIDIALPRDIDPAVNELDEVYLYDLDAIEQVARENRAQREEQIQRCEAIIERELEAGQVLRARSKAVS